MTMSTTDTTSDAIELAEEQFHDGDTAAAFKTLVDEVQQLHEENQEMAERVDELEQEIDERGYIEWDSVKPRDIKIVSSTGENQMHPYKTIPELASEETVQELEERIRAVEEGEADIVVRSEADRDALPIENRIARRKAGDDSLTKNEERATIVFPKFGSHAESWNGQLKLSSQDVRTILAEQTDKDREDWNTNTINRIMRKLAELTSTEDKDDRYAKDEDNLLTLQKGEKRLILVADREEWMEFLQEVSEE